MKITQRAIFDFSPPTLFANLRLNRINHACIILIPKSTFLFGFRDIGIYYKLCLDGRSQRLHVYKKSSDSKEASIRKFAPHSLALFKKMYKLEAGNLFTGNLEFLSQWLFQVASTLCFLFKLFCYNVNVCKRKKKVNKSVVVVVVSSLITEMLRRTVDSVPLE